MKRDEIKIAVIGDSISQGLGSKKYNYCENLKRNLKSTLNIEFNIKNFAFTGKTIFYANEIKEDIREFNPNIIISFFGSVDGMIRPTKKKFIWNILPKRYRGNGMLDPRPFYSSNKKRAIIERIDSFVRWHIKLVLMNICGTSTWVTLEEFEYEYRKFLDSFKDIENILLVSTVYIDEKYFPNSNLSYKKYNQCIKKLANEYKRDFIDVYSMQKKLGWEEIYGDDHFHPNKNGYVWYADVFSEVITKKTLI